MLKLTLPMFASSVFKKYLIPYILYSKQQIKKKNLSYFTLKTVFRININLTKKYISVFASNLKASLDGKCPNEIFPGKNANASTVFGDSSLY